VSFELLYLVDTNIISATAPFRPAPEGLIDWMDRQSDALFISVITVTEIESGIAKARRDNAHRKAAGLSAWSETLLHLYAARILPLNIASARAAGTMADRARAHCEAPGFADIAIAATARTHGLTILSRNIRHLAPLGVAILDPFAELPPG
jgi:predicted nucleic acid-binding protein